MATFTIRYRIQQGKRIYTPEIALTNVAPKDLAQAIETIKQKGGTMLKVVEGAFFEEEDENDASL